MNSTIITKATTADIPVISSMAGIVFRHTYSNILTTGQVEYMMEWMYSTESLKKQLKDGHCFFLACNNNTPVGYMSIQNEGVNDEGITVFHLHKLYVMTEMKGCGVGKLLFKKACEYAKENKKTTKARIELNVNRFNKAKEFYLRMGMKVAREGDFAIGNGYYMNDYIMSLEI